MAELIREKGSKNLRAAYGYATGGEVINNFDSKYPWVKMEYITDADGNKWTRIFKFYTHYVLDEEGHIKARYISEYEIDENWHLNPIFIDANGRELAYVDIAAYQTALDGGRIVSKSGVAPLVSKTIQEMRDYVSVYNTFESEFEYGLFNIWASILEQDLFLVEFANSNTSEVLRGCGYNSWKNGLKATGATDNIEYVTGTRNASAQENGSDPMKYRGIENMIGNGRLVLDGIKVNNGKILVSYDGSTYVDSGLTAHDGSGRIHKLSFNSESKLVFPGVISTTGSYNDRYMGNDDPNQIVLRGYLDQEGAGLFATVFTSESSSNKYNTYRMIRRPKY